MCGHQVVDDAIQDSGNDAHEDDAADLDELCRHQEEPLGAGSLSGLFLGAVDCSDFSEMVCSTVVFAVTCLPCCSAVTSPLDLRVATDRTGNAWVAAVTHSHVMVPLPGLALKVVPLPSAGTSRFIAGASHEYWTVKRSLAAVGSLNVICSSL